MHQIEDTYFADVNRAKEEALKANIFGVQDPTLILYDDSKIEVRERLFLLFSR